MGAPEALFKEWGLELPRLRGPRLDLRWLDASDSPALYEIFADPDVTRYWSSPPLAGLEGAEALVEDVHRSYAGREAFEWAIWLRETEQLAGTCTIYHFEWEQNRAEIGFALARRFWGQGFATEALSLLIGFAFETLGFRRLEADVDPDNERSIRALEKQGFRREGILRERWLHLGELRDTVFMGLLRREWSQAVGPPR